jgi:hypothetical protein
VSDERRAWLEDLDACAVACEEAFERLRAESASPGLGALERELLLAAAVTRTACGEGADGAFEGEVLANLMVVAAEAAERAAASCAAAGDAGLTACRDACLAAASAARNLAPRAFSNGH